MARPPPGDRQDYGNKRGKEQEMKRIFTIVLMVVFFAAPMQAFAAQHIERDKAAHIGACYGAELVLSQSKPFRHWKPWQRVLFTTAVIGGGKEWYDARHPKNHSAEWGDVAADFVGAVSSESTLWLVQKAF